MDILGLGKELGLKCAHSSGKSIQFCCPFHNERRPSFGIEINYPNRFNCFTCSVKGNIILLIQRLLHLDPLQAWHVASKYGYQSKDEKVESPIPVEFKDIHLEKYKRLVSKIKFIRISKKTAEDWELGYDVLDNRVTFPIRDETGKLIGISGRTVINEEPRYKFLAGTLKGDVLYGLHKVDTKGCLILVEGFMDVLKLYDLGVHNAIAIMGNMITKEQLSLLIAHTDCVIVGLDNDKVGKESTYKIIKMLKGHVKLYVADQYPEGIKDPGDFKSKEQVLEWLKNRRIVL